MGDICRCPLPVFRSGTYRFLCDMLYRQLFASVKYNSGLFSRGRYLSTSISLKMKVGDVLPSINLHENTPGTNVNINELFAGKKGILFAVPGAFTPGCSKTHLPGYISEAENLKNAGIELVVCVSVNDAFVMGAWGEAHGAESKVKMLADPSGEFTRAVGMEIDLSAPLGTKRSKRYAAIIEDSTVLELKEEPDGTGLTCSLASSVLEHLSK